MRTRAGALLCLALPSLLASEPMEATLKQVDRLRYPWPSFSVDIRIQTDHIQQAWRVKVRSNGDARVEGLSEKEKGRTVLLLGDEMWMLLPGTRNPVKVSPQQRLLGPAAGGDIARFHFSEDYTPLQESEALLENHPCRRMELQAKRSSISYRTAILWISKDGKPIRAEFFLASGKLARTLRFGKLQTVRGLQVLSGMSFQDPAGQQAELSFEDWKPTSLEPGIFVIPGQHP